MLKFFGPKRPRVPDESSVSIPIVQPLQTLQDEYLEVDPNDIVLDPALRKPIHSYDVNMQDHIRRHYITSGPCQPKGYNFPRKLYSGNHMRSFRDNWYEKFDWLEYSVSKDATFCFSCFLFKENIKDNDVFTKIGMSNWKDALEKYRNHVGSVGSEHNKARIKFENFKYQEQSLSHIVQGYNLRREAYPTCLIATLDVIRLLLQQGLPMREHDDSSISHNRGNFLELLEWYGQRNEDFGSVIFDNAPGNNESTSPHVQKDMVNACASVTTLAILDDLGERLFSILVDDCCIEEQMVVIIRYVNICGQIVERFLGLVHLRETTVECLKEGIDSLFVKHGLSLLRLRGQGYGGASNMRNEFNGLKALILRENPSAWYVHCFAHQVLSVIVDVCKANRYTCEFFNNLELIVSVCGSSCNRVDSLQQLEHDRKVAELEAKEKVFGTEKNHETFLKRLCDTRWGSYYITIIRLKDMWPEIIEVLENVFEDGIEHESSASVRTLLNDMQSFEFVFPMVLMNNLLGMTDKLSMVLQEGDHDMLNVINQIRSVKKDLQQYKDFGWDKLLEEVETFCIANQIQVINMEEIVPRLVRVKRDGRNITNYHHYRVEIVSEVIESVIQEMDHRFSEASIELLDCFACLDPKNKFSKFNVDKLCHLTNFYPNDFSKMDCLCMPQELHSFFSDVREDNRFFDVDNLESLARKMKETGKDRLFSLVYRVVELVLLLPVVAALDERVISIMKYVKTDLRERMGDEWLNDRLVVFIERDIFAAIDNDIILQRFQEMDCSFQEMKAIKTEHE